MNVHKGSDSVVLANPVYLAGYIERLGTGTTDIVSLCEQDGLPTPQFAQDAFFKVTIYRKLKAAESNNDKLGQSNKEENAENTFVNNAFGCIHSGIDSKQSNKESNIGSNIGNIDSNIDSLTYQQQTVVRGDRSCES
jgi:predicted HTH transcriptional regulator